MGSLSLRLPAMYADHHVLRVREALSQLGGVTQTIASAARRQVTVKYEDGAVSPEDIQQALAEAGYSPEQEVALSEMPERSKDGSAWYEVIQRVTTTEMRDLEMSGDFRRY